jgi:hypothetical protein
MSATISLLGLYNYDNSILDGLVIPSNFPNGSLETLKNNLLMETAELELLYTDPIFLKFAVKNWCDKNFNTWKWLRDTQLYEYNPIWNADYRITDDTLETRDLAGTKNGQENFTRGLNESEDITRNTNSVQTDDRVERTDYDETNDQEIKNHTNAKTGHDDSLHKVYAYNDSSTGSPESSDTTTYNSTNTENGKNEGTIASVNTRANTGTTDVTTRETVDRDVSQTGGTTTTSTNNSTDTGTVDTTYSRLLQGNYGTTTTQKMITEEQELAKLNLIDFIITDFKKRFCLMVY